MEAKRKPSTASKAVSLARKRLLPNRTIVSVTINTMTPLRDIWKKFMDSVLNGQPKKGFPDAPRVGDTDKGDPLAPSPPPPSNPPDGNGNQDGNGNGNLPPCTPPNVPPACIPTPSNPVPLPSQSKHG